MCHVNPRLTVIFNARRSYTRSLKRIYLWRGMQADISFSSPASARVLARSVRDLTRPMTRGRVPLRIPSLPARIPENSSRGKFEGLRKFKEVEDSECVDVLTFKRILNLTRFGPYRNWDLQDLEDLKVQKHETKDIVKSKGKKKAFWNKFSRNFELKISLREFYFMIRFRVFSNLSFNFFEFSFF